MNEKKKIPNIQHAINELNKQAQTSTVNRL